MSRLRGLKYAIAALVCIAAFAILLTVTAQPAAAAPLPGEIFIDMDGDRTFNASVDLGLFDTIQYAIDNATSGDVIVVGSGNYTETLTIPIDISLVGANEGIDPNTWVRGSETCLIPNANALGPLVMLGSNHVTIDGFSFNGSNPLLPSYGTINGVNLTMQFFLQNSGGENNFTFVNNIVSTFDTAINLQGESRNNSLSANQFDNIQPVSLFGQGIHLETDYFANITYNVFTRTNLAIFASSCLATGSTNIDSNNMSVNYDGIFLNRIGGAGGLWAVSNNIIEAIGSANAGIQVQGIEGSSAGVDLSFNMINATVYGILLIDNPTTVGVNVIGGLITDCNYAIYAQEGVIASETGDSVYTVDGVLIVNPASYGIYIDNTNSFGSTVTRVNIQNGNIVLGGLNGVGVEGSGAMAFFYSAEPINLIGVTDQYIRLIGSPRDIDATQVLFDNDTGANVTLAQRFAIEDKIFHALDQSGLGLVTFVVGQEFVTPLSGSIQRAIDVAIAGSIIHVQAGTYVETLTVSASVSLFGPNAGIDPNTGVRGPEAKVIPSSGTSPLVDITVNGVVIDGFVFDGSNALLPTQTTFNGVNIAVRTGISNSVIVNDLTLRNNILLSFSQAVELTSPSTGSVISNNRFDNLAGHAVKLSENFFANITSNVVTRTNYAISVDPYDGSGTVLIDGNNLTIYGNGIELAGISGDGTYIVSNNAIYSEAGGVALNAYLANSVWEDVTLQFVDNLASGVENGYVLIDCSVLSGVSVSGGRVVNASIGLLAVEQQSAGYGSGLDAMIMVSSVEFNNSTSWAMVVWDFGANPGLTTLSISGNTSVIDSLNGIEVVGPDAVLVFDGASPIEFLSVADQYILLSGSPRDIDATQVLFEGLIGVNMTLEQDFAVEDKVYHALDVNGLGFVEWTLGNAYVTQLSGSIERGVLASGDGFTIHVGVGNFTEQIYVAKTLEMLGAGAGITNIIAPDPLVDVSEIVTFTNAATVVFDGFTVTGPSSNIVAGLRVTGGADVSILNCVITDIRRAANPFSTWPFAIRVGDLVFAGGGNALIQNNTITNLGVGGVSVEWETASAHIIGNSFIGSGTSIGDGLSQRLVEMWNGATGSILNNTFTGIGGEQGGHCIILGDGTHDVDVRGNILVGLGIGAPASTADLAEGILIIGIADGSSELVDSILVQSNTITQFYTGISVLAQVGGAVISNNLIADNTRFGILLAGAANVTITGNNILDNQQNGILSDETGMGIEVHDNNIAGNIIGVINLGTSVIDARLNWWGHVTGPGGDAPGLGDPILMSFDDNILYSPWLVIPFPPEVPVNGTIDVLNATHPVTFEGDGLTLVVSMTGTGDHVVALLQYTDNPNGAVYWHDGNVYFDFMIFDTTGITQVELRAYYDPLNLPEGIVESELRAYWSEGGIWKACSDSGVNLAEDYVWVLLRADTIPSLAQLVGTPFMLGTPVASFAPSVGSAGSLLSALKGAGFNVNQMVTLYLEDTPIAQTMTDASGNFSSVSGFIPNVLPGVYDIRVQDESGFVVSGLFTVVSTTPIDITLDVGSLYFPGESVTWYAMFVMNGQMLDPDTIVATLYGPEALVVDLSGNLTRLTTGLWTINGTMPGDASAGEYTMVVTANISDSNFGATLRTFLISATLMDQYSLIVSIDDDIAGIQTSIGTILVDLSEISANLTAIEGSLATIQTSIGVLQVDIGLINATLARVNGTMVTIQTTLGDIIVQLDEIYTGIEDIQGDIAFVNTTLGMVQVTVEAIHAVVLEINGTVVTIKTDLGSVIVNVTAINARVTSINNTLVTVRTDIGLLQTSVTNVNAHLTAVQNDVATVQTTVGAITVNLAALNTTVTSIHGNVATIQTSLGTITGNVTGIEGNIATIQTNLGTMQTDITGLQGSMVDNGNIGLMSIVMLIMVLFILVAMYFWRLRKVL